MADTLPSVEATRENAERLIGDIVASMEGFATKSGVARFTAGISGSGKSNALGSFGSMSGFVPVDPDWFRYAIDGYDRLVREHGPVSAASMTQKLTGLAAVLLRNEAIERGFDYFVDSTMANPKNAEIELGKAVNNGYSVEMRVVVAHPAEAFVRNLSRMSDAAESGGLVRLVSFDRYAPMVEGLRDTVGIVGAMAKRYGDNFSVKVFDGFGRMHYDSSRSPYRLSGSLYDGILQNEEKVRIKSRAFAARASYECARALSFGFQGVEKEVLSFVDYLGDMFGSKSFVEKELDKAVSDVAKSSVERGINAENISMYEIERG